MCAHQPSDPSVPREGYIPLENAALYFRDIGHGEPIILVHGGPDFDHNYLLPDMDRLSDRFRLIYYDQRGRGKSTGSSVPEDITLQSEIRDLESVRMHFQLDRVAILGHSWGGVLAMEYAIRYPNRVSHLILMNTAPASHSDYLLLRDERQKKAPEDMEKLKALGSTARYQEGDLAADAEYYRIHFRSTLRQPDDLERIIKSLRSDFTEEGIRRAREIEDRLMNETWRLKDYDLLPELSRLRLSTLVLYGDRDLVPLACAEHIAQAIPGARLIVLKETGHFSYIESPGAVRREIVALFHDT